MLHLCHNGRRRISLLLLLLLITAAPMRSSPIARSAEDALVAWRSSSSRDWPNFQQRFHATNGRPLPKTLSGEMTDELVDNDATPKAANFLQPLPSSSNWMQPLQVHRTWLQSPERSRSKLKRDHQEESIEAPFAYYFARSRASSKREPSTYQGPLFRPSISHGVMGNLGDFFNQLKANVHYAEHRQQHLGEEESQLLEGVHPHQKLQLSGDDYDSGQPPDLVQTKLHSYRPSQKIRSLVSRNPNGYRGSQFIDPSYMWLGLG